MGDYLRAPRSRALSALGRPYHDAVGRSRWLHTSVGKQLSAKTYDVIVASQLFVASAIPANVRTKAIFDSHNVETVRTRDSLVHRGGLAMAASSAIVASVARLERRTIRTFATTVACSQHDADLFRGMAPEANIEIVPNGSDMPAELAVTRPAGRTILFMASLSSSANVDSLAHLIDDVLPHLPPDVVVHVAGSGAGPDAQAVLARADSRVRYLGYVLDAHEAMRKADVMIVPLRVGSGTRLKILEAFAVGVPVATTPKGSEGLPIQPGVHAAIAAEPREMARQVAALLDHPEQRAAMARAARQFVERTSEWTAITERFVDVLRQVRRDS